MSSIHVDLLNNITAYQRFSSLLELKRSRNMWKQTSIPGQVLSQRFRYYQILNLNFTSHDFVYSPGKGIWIIFLIYCSPFTPHFSYSADISFAIVTCNKKFQNCFFQNYIISYHINRIQFRIYAFNNTRPLNLVAC
jgi:hypothetical protein